MVPSRKEIFLMASRPPLPTTILTLMKKSTAFVKGSWRHRRSGYEWIVNEMERNGKKEKMFCVWVFGRESEVYL